MECLHVDHVTEERWDYRTYNKIHSLKNGKRGASLSVIESLQGHDKKYVPRRYYIAAMKDVAES